MGLFARRMMTTLVHIADLFPKLGHRSLVVVDLDNTLHRSKSLEGSELFLETHTQALVEKGLSKKEAFLHANSFYNSLHQQNPTSIAVDKTLDWQRVLADFKAKEISLLGLTARDPIITDATLSQMNSIGVRFTSGIIPDMRTTIEGRQVVIKSSVVLTNELPKGKTMAHLMPYFNIPLKDYSAIHFVDDKHSNCESMLNFFTKHQLNGFTYHYPKVSQQGMYDKTLIRALVDSVINASAYPGGASRL